MTRRLLLYCLFFLTAASATAQDARILPLDDPAYAWISRLQDRGVLKELNPTARPYARSAIARALSSADSSRLRTPERRWFDALKSRFAGDSQRRQRIGGDGELAARATNHGRIDPVRFLGENHPTIRGVPYSIDLRAFPVIAAGLYAISGPFAVRTGFESDAYFDTDPDGIDSAHRWYSRSEDTYVRWEGVRASVGLGRFARNWGSGQLPGLILSDNPRPLDALEIRLGAGRISMQSILAELDSITGDGRFTGTAGDDSVRTGSERRWLSAHRLDFVFRSGFRIYLMESVLYSGPSAGPSLRFANPLHLALALVDETPKNEENNGMVGAGFWHQTPGFVGEAQILVDDLDVLNARESASWAGSARLRLISLVAGGDIELQSVAVAARTYNTFQTEGQYVFMRRGIGTAFSDYVRLALSGSWFLNTSTFDLTLRPHLALLWQGERDLRQVYSSADDDFRTILTGTVARTSRAGVLFSVMRRSSFQFYVDAGVNHTTNDLHIEGRSRTRFVATAGLSINYGFERELP